jgi:hypothetical protein
VGWSERSIVVGRREREPFQLEIERRTGPSGHFEEEQSIDPIRFEGHVHQVESWDDLQRRAAGADRAANVERSRARVTSYRMISIGRSAT